MTSKWLRFIGLVLIAISIGIPPITFGQTPNSTVNSLGELARQFKEQRADSGLTPVRVLTNDDFPPSPTPNSLNSSSKPTAERASDNATTSPPEVRETTDFRPVEAESVNDVTKPYLSIAYGTVVLDVLISDKGEVENVQVRRDVASLTEEAIRSVRTWTFEPAKHDGKAVTSRITVAVTFNPETALVVTNVPLPPLIHQDDEARIQSSFQPPEVTLAILPEFPASALGPATVILEATVDEAGKAQSTKVLRDVSPFTVEAVRAVEDWRFMPATLNGAPLISKAILAFVFSQPYNETY